MLDEAETHGFLIDLDLAVYFNREEASGAPARTGINVFMASRVLVGRSLHNFVYDLESFFWVIFWTCIHCTGPRGMGRHDTQFVSWNFKTWDDLAVAKDGVIQQQHFERMLREYASGYGQPLLPIVIELHETLHPNGTLPTVDNKSLYGKMKEVLQAGIDDLPG
jgi:hypothetical protein